MMTTEDREMLLEKMRSPLRRPLVVMEILERIAVDFGATAHEILGGRRHRNLVAARMCVAYELREKGYTLQQIGRWLKRDHSTVLYGIRKVDRMLSQAKAVAS